jgi:hypothetical protein
MFYSVAMACWLRHYHVGAEARWMGKSSDRTLGRGAGGPNPWAGLLEKVRAQG